MALDSYLELFTTLYGWLFYNVIFETIAITGIIFLPFVGIIIDVWKDAHQQGVEGGGPAAAVRVLEWEVIIACLVLAVAVSPSPLTLDRLKLTYTPYATRAEPAPATVNATNSNTQFDNTFAANFQSIGNPAVRVPLWWYSVMAVSSGLSHAMRAGMNVPLDDLRQYEQSARLAAIRDPGVRVAAQQFFNECYLPARTKYLAGVKDLPAVKTFIANLGTDDVDWMGSQVMVLFPELYPALNSQSPVPGAPVNITTTTSVTAPPPDWDVSATDVPPASGRVNCATWWTSDTPWGLRNQLVSQTDSLGLIDRMKKTFATFVNNDEKAKQIAARLVLANTNFPLTPQVATFGQPAPQSVETAMVPGIGSLFTAGGRQALNDSIGGIAIVWEYLKLSIYTNIVKQGIYFVQPIVLMGLYVLLPLFMLVSRFSVTAMIEGALAIFTVKFWSVLWYLTMWLDDNLLRSLYPGESMLSLSVLASGDFVKRMVLDMTLMTLYIGLPLLWSLLMAAAGIRVGQALTDFKSASMGPIIAAGKGAVGIGTGVIKAVATKGRSLAAGGRRK
jgi:hypothetical protein